jgi:hypothetical protein
LVLGIVAMTILDTPIAVSAALFLDITLAIAKTYSYRSIKDLVIENATIHKNNKESLSDIDI